MITASRVRLQAWTRNLVAVGSAWNLPLPITRFFSSTSLRSMSSKKHGHSPSSSNMLPVVTKERLKTMATAEICLYMKAKKNDSYDVLTLSHFHRRCIHSCLSSRSVTTSSPMFVCSECVMCRNSNWLFVRCSNRDGMHL